MKSGAFFALLIQSLCVFSLCGHDLVELREVNPRIQVQMRYATVDNPLGRVVYPYPGCFLVREAAEKLSRVQKDLEKHCLTLIVWDAYRPYSMHPPFWSEFAHCGKIYGSILGNEAEDAAGHCRGTAVDVSMAYVDGAALAMPTDYEEFSDRSLRSCCSLEAHVYHNRQFLEKAMARHGFVPATDKWWHFQYRGGLCYPVLDVKFEDLYVRP